MPHKYLYDQLLNGCPRCKSHKNLGMIAGPTAGSALANQNVMCRDPDCRAEYNVSQMAAWAHPNGRADIERYLFFENGYRRGRFRLWEPRQRATGT